MRIYRLAIRCLENVYESIRKVHYKLLYGKRLTWSKLKIRGKGKVFNIQEEGSIKIGSAFFNSGCKLNAHKEIVIGHNCLFGENVKIYDHNHVYSNLHEPISNQGFICKPVYIGDNCWIGSNVTILQGVHIGDNVVIGANCLIYKDIPSNVVVKANDGYTISQR